MCNLVACACGLCNTSGETVGTRHFSLLPKNLKKQLVGSIAPVKKIKKKRERYQLLEKETIQREIGACGMERLMNLGNLHPLAKFFSVTYDL